MNLGFVAYPLPYKGAHVNKTGRWLVVFFLLLSLDTVQAQPPKILRIGFLSAASASAVSARDAAFRQRLRELGYVEGKNIIIEWRYAEGKRERLREFAAELVRLKVDAIVSGGPTATQPAKEATDSIPIVIVSEDDPVGSGL